MKQAFNSVISIKQAFNSGISIKQAFNTCSVISINLYPGKIPGTLQFVCTSWHIDLRILFYEVADDKWLSQNDTAWYKTNLKYYKIINVS